MGELWDAISAKFLNKRDRSETQEKVQQQRVKNTIIHICDEKLKDASQSFVFESSQSDLPHVLIVIGEEPLKSKYDISQISETLFSAKLRALPEDF